MAAQAAADFVDGFPGGLGEFVAPAGAYLVFEDGPSADVRLQWATYFDASDQAGQSRIYGGIHFPTGNTGGRTLGECIGTKVVERFKVAHKS